MCIKRKKKHQIGQHISLLPAHLAKIMWWPVADLEFWKGMALFSKGGAVVGKNHFLRSIRGTVNSFSHVFAGKNRKIFREGEGDRPQRPPLNPPLVVAKI
jgi:hypothetical protein